LRKQTHPKTTDGKAPQDISTKQIMTTAIQSMGYNLNIPEIKEGLLSRKPFETFMIDPLPHQVQEEISCLRDQCFMGLLSNIDRKIYGNEIENIEAITELAFDLPHELIAIMNDEGEIWVYERGSIKK
jgi:hypothetical protein